MTNSKGQPLTEGQRKAAAFLTRRPLRFEPGWHENQRRVTKQIAAEVLAEKIANAQAGQPIPGHGVFLGQYSPKDRDDKSLGRVFNVFAAPQDLTDESGQKATFTYNDAVKRIAGLKGWNGFDGTNYASDKEIYKALEDGSYNGGWIIPTRDILVGTEVDGRKIQPDSLYAHKNSGVLKGTFAEGASGSVYPGWYWSSTEHRDDSSYVRAVRFSGGYELWHPKDGNRFSCRPVRLVATSSAPALG